MRIPQYDSHVSGDLTINPDGTVTRVAPFSPGQFFDDLIWWAGQLLDVKPGDPVTGVYRLVDDEHTLDPDTVSLCSISEHESGAAN